MKDGGVQTNPGVNNPDIVAPIGTTDERVHVLRFDREGKDSVLLVNFANHPDVVGGNGISGDWPSMTRRFTEKALDNVKCIFFNGAQGDVNHVNVHPTAGDFNDMFNDFDGCSRGYGHARHIARVVTGAVLSAFDKVEYVDVDSIRTVNKAISLPTWNKQKHFGEAPYDKYKLSANRYGYTSKPYYALCIRTELGVDYELYFPCYELPIMQKLTGLSPVQ